MSVLRIETPTVFEPLLLPARYKGAHGGRGSAKSHHFAEAMVEKAVLIPGFRGLCIREVQLINGLREESHRLRNQLLKLRAFADALFRHIAALEALIQARGGSPPERPCLPTID